MKFEYQNSTLIAALPTCIVTTIACVATHPETISWTWQMPFHVLILLFTLFVANESSYGRYNWLRLVALGLYLVCVVALMALTNHSTVMIYSVMMASILPHFISVRLTFSYVVLSCLTLVAMHYWLWLDYLDWLSAMVWGVFHIFAITLAINNLQRSRSENQAILARQQMEATQTLLQHSSKQQERLRISRELHDAIGHQLTAMTIKLDVARRMVESPEHQQELAASVNQLYDVSKGLLEEVREIVSDQRHDQGLKIKQTIAELCNELPRLDCDLIIDELLTINSTNISHCILRCCQESVSNTLKHGKANRIKIELSESANSYLLVIEDNGTVQGEIQYGNGLTGMTERVQALGGTVSLSKNKFNSLKTEISIPHDN